MKIFFTLLLATIFTTSAFALNESRLTITVSNPNEVQVMIDNRSYRLDDNSIILDNISAGQHTIQVYRGRANNNRGNSRNSNRNNVLYSSTIYVKPNYDVDIMINRFGKALVDERDLRYNNDGYGNYGTNNGNYGNNGNNGNNGGYGNNNYNQPMQDYEFNQLIQKIRSQWFGKQNAAKDAISTNYFTTLQVKQILQLFSSETDKLELAKLAYRNTVDQRSYTQLYDVFSSDRSREELDQYIRNNRW